MATQSKESLQQSIVTALNTYCFQNIWNETKSEFRTNIVPGVVNKRPMPGKVSYKNELISLPTEKEGYYVYTISSSVTQGINNKPIEHSKWIDTATLCNEQNILLETYHISGKMFHKGFVYLYKLRDGAGYLLAVNQAMAETFILPRDMLIKNQVVSDDDFDMSHILTKPNINDITSAIELKDGDNIDNLSPGFYIHYENVKVVTDKFDIVGNEAIYHTPYSDSLKYSLVHTVNGTQYAVAPDTVNAEGNATEELSKTRSLRLVHNLESDKYEEEYTKWTTYRNKVAVDDAGVEYYSYLPLIRVTIYYDSDISNKITVKSWKLEDKPIDVEKQNEIYKFISDCGNNRDHLTIFINGYETYLKDASIFTLNSYIDVIHDKNTVITYDIDLENNNDIYYSDKDKVYKQLIHLPKELNPNNEIFTHNTMSIYVRPKVKNQDNSVSIGNGVYLHRCARRGVSQVTHNDISIPTFILDAFRDHLNNQKITLHIKIRRHDKDNILIRDKSYIDLLYQLDDQTIIDHLLGRIWPEKLDFWKASNLEKSKYVEMMFDVPTVITPKNMYDYVEGLGYYQTISLLCQKVQHTVITEWFGGALYFNKPYLYQNHPIYPLVYINGKKINNNHVLVNNDEPLKVGVGVDNTVKVNLGDIMTVEMYLDGSTRVFGFTPTEEISYIDIPYSSFDLLEEIELINPQKALDEEVKYYYSKPKDTEGFLSVINSPDIEGFTRIIFAPSLYNKTFIIQNNTRVFRMEKSLDDLMVNGDPLILDISQFVEGINRFIPIYHAPRVVVFLNNKYLIKDIDYVIAEIRDSNGEFIGRKLVIQNFQYLKESNNKVEFFVTSAEVEHRVSGFVVNDKAYKEDELTLLFNNMSLIHVDGDMEYDTVNKGSYIQLPQMKYRQGAIFECCTAIPSTVKEFIDTYHDNDDLSRLEILNEYFYGKTPPYPDKLILDQSHKCYSVFTAPIIRDIVNKTANISLDPDIERFVKQLIDYRQFKDIDLVYNKKLDLRFIDVYPHYRNFEVDNVTDYSIVESIVNNLIPDDIDTGYEIYNQ